MPCLEWLAEKLEWEQGSGPNWPMSCRTQGWISRRPERAYLRPWWQLSMLFNRNFAFFQFLVNLPCYSMGILHFSQFSLFSMLFNGNHAIFHFFVNFLCYSMGSLYFVNFPCYSMGIQGLRSFGGGDVRTNGRTDVQTDVWKFTPVTYRTSALWGRCPALTPLLHLITPSRASCTADHVWLI